MAACPNGISLTLSPEKLMLQSFRVSVRSLALSLCGTLGLLAPAWAVDPFTVRDIRVEGLQRVEPGTVFASIPVRVGDQYSDEKGAAAIRGLFAVCLF